MKPSVHLHAIGPQPTVVWRVFLALLVSVGLWWPVVGHTGEDHDRARQALQAGQILPLQQVLERLQRAEPGQVLEVELEQSDGVWVYDVKLLQPDGRLAKFEIDAASGEVIRRKSHGRHGRVPRDLPR